MKKLITKNFIQIDLADKNPTKVVKCLLKLKEYEDTNLTPKEVMNLKNEIDDLKETLSKYENFIKEALHIGIKEKENLVLEDDKESRDKLFEDLMKKLNPSKFENNFNTKP